LSYSGIDKVVSMARVLLVDDDSGTLETWSAFLRAAGFDVLTVTCGRDAIELASSGWPHVILVDLKLPDMSGLELLARLRVLELSVPAVVVTGFGSIPSAVQAIKLGAVDYLEKPLFGDEIVRTANLGLFALQGYMAERSGRLSDPEAHAASRWANAVVSIIDAPKDPRTLAGWGRSVGVSVGALKNWCRTVGLSSKRSLDFARLLRAVVRHNTDGLRPADALDVVDKRTLSRLLSLTGSNVDHCGFPNQVEAFLETQVIIRDAIILTEVRRALRKSKSTAVSAMSDT
jgi:ActR/RegA family two-component response regulator